MLRLSLAAVGVILAASPHACNGVSDCAAVSETQWDAEDQESWHRSHSCPRVKMMTDAGATFYPDSNKVFDPKVTAFSSESASCGYRLAMVFPWVDWGKTAAGVTSHDEVIVPSYFRFWAESAGMNAGLVDFLVFTTPTLEPHYVAAAKGIPNVKIFVLQDIAAFYAERLGIPDLLVDGEVLKDLKPMHGFVFESYLTEYSHWGFGDIDLIYGDLSRFLLPLLDKKDIITIHASEKPPLDLTNGLHLCKFVGLTVTYRFWCWPTFNQMDSHRM